MKGTKYLSFLIGKIRQLLVTDGRRLCLSNGRVMHIPKVQKKKNQKDWINVT